MSWAAIIALVLQILKERAEAGWPLLKAILALFGDKIQRDADADVAPLTVGAAPDEVKDMIVAWLEAQKAKAGPVLRGIYTIVIRFVPLIADQLWDSLFQAGHVSKPLSDFTPAVFAAGADDEATILAD